MNHQQPQQGQQPHQGQQRERPEAHDKGLDGRLDGSQHPNRRIALVLGATGGIGGEVARSLRQRGWTVRALHRRSSQPPAPGKGGAFEWIQGDAMNAADVSAAARGADVLVHAVNPPGYRRWSELVLPMLDNSIAAARANGLLLLLPGTVYNFGSNLIGDTAGDLADDGPGEVTEDAPQQPTTRKGLIRVEMERRLRAAAALGVRSLVVRAGDFFGPRAGNNWFSQGLVKPGRPIKAVANPGRAGVGHQWAYLPDVARTMVELVERRDELETFSVFHMQGHWDCDGTEVIAAIRRASGNLTLPVRSFPWWLVRMASPVVPLFRELEEMQYLWQQPLRMSNRRLVGFLGKEPVTPLDEAVRLTLQGLGCIPQEAAASSRIATSPMVG